MITPCAEHSGIKARLEAGDERMTELRGDINKMRAEIEKFRADIMDEMAALRTDIRKYADQSNKMIIDFMQSFNEAFNGRDGIETRVKDLERYLSFCKWLAGVVGGGGLLVMGFFREELRLFVKWLLGLE